MNVLEPLEAHQRQVWGHQSVSVRHHLADVEVFDDEYLAAMIEKAAPANLAIHTEGGTDRASWPCVRRGSASGDQVIDAVREGMLWVNLVGISEWDPRFAQLADQLFAELAKQLPGWGVVKRKVGVLISSPKATVPYHVDVPGQAIWQVRGRKRFFLYPNTAPFLSQVELERAVRSASYGVASYQPWYDQHAHPYDLAPGDALAWALNGPHRIENGNEVSVSLTCEFWTRDIRNRYAVNYGNGLLRHYGWTPRSCRTSGPAFWAKAGLTAAYRTTGLQNSRGYQRVATLTIDPDHPTGARGLPESEWAVPGT